MSDYERIEKVIRYLERHYLSQPSLGELARVAGLSEFYFHRLFRRWAGTTPKAFLRSLSAKRARELLLDSRDLLSASLEAGLSGPGRLHDLMIAFEAMTPGELKAGGRGVEIRYGFHASPFGECLLGLTGRGLCHLAFLEGGREKAFAEMKACWPNASFRAGKAETAKLARRIFGKSRRGKVRLLLQGTPFQVKVWEALLRIPEGAVASYAGLAELAGAKRAARAVGTAIGRNSIAYLIPCHRVIRETGVMGQYRWGAARKRALLGWEQARRGSDTP